MTEASHQIASSPLPPPAPRAATVGVSAGAESASPTRRAPSSPLGSAGEALIRGDWVYERLPLQKTRRRNRDVFVQIGLFRTGGDLGLAGRRTGYLQLVGRLKDMRSSAVENIAAGGGGRAACASRWWSTSRASVPHAKKTASWSRSRSRSTAPPTRPSWPPIAASAPRGVQGAERHPHSRRGAADRRRQAPAPAHRGPLRRALMRFAVVGAAWIGARTSAPRSPWRRRRDPDRGERTSSPRHAGARRARGAPAATSDADLRDGRLRRDPRRRCGLPRPQDPQPARRGRAVAGAALAPGAAVIAAQNGLPWWGILRRHPGALEDLRLQQASTSVAESRRPSMSTA